jgi:hypothetical protein
MKKIKVLAICLWLSLPLFAQTVLDWTKVPGARIQIQIQENTSQGQYNDSLYYTADEWAKLTQRDIDTAKAKRVSDWIAAVVAASKVIPAAPTTADLLVQQDETQKRMDSILLQLSATASKTDLQAVADKLKATTDALSATISKARVDIAK